MSDLFDAREGMFWCAVAMMLVTMAGEVGRAYYSTNALSVEWVPASGSEEGFVAFVTDETLALASNACEDECAGENAKVLLGYRASNSSLVEALRVAESCHAFVRVASVQVHPPGNIRYFEDDEEQKRWDEMLGQKSYDNWTWQAYELLHIEVCE